MAVTRGCLALQVVHKKKCWEATSTHKQFHRVTHEKVLKMEICKKKNFEIFREYDVII